jgi:hypothetical protein
VLARQEVRRERSGRDDPGDEADRVEADVLPRLGHEAEPRERPPERGPDAAPDRLVPDEARPQRDQDRRGELEQEPDADREPLDRDEVEPLDEREPDDAVLADPRSPLGPVACPVEDHLRHRPRGYSDGSPA